MNAKNDSSREKKTTSVEHSAKYDYGSRFSQLDTVINIFEGILYIIRLCA